MMFMLLHIFYYVCLNAEHILIVYNESIQGVLTYEGGSVKDMPPAYH